MYASIFEVCMCLIQELFAQSPYGDCVDTNKPDFVNPLKFHDTYTYTACKLEHRVGYIYKICKCIMYYDPGNAMLLLAYSYFVGNDYYFSSQTTYV